ncbi:MAG: HNH endonuclease [Aggregatilineales bacterium]
MTEHSWVAIRRIVFERAEGCCEYCQTCEENTGQAMHIEHIDPQGGDILENLCLACANCNLSKAAATTAIDPQTEQIVRLFHPRQQNWSTHFEWTTDGLRLQGKTPAGRATIDRLKINQERIVRARRNWILARTHPPDTPET